MHWHSTVTGAFMTTLLLFASNSTYAGAIPDAGILLQQQQRLDSLPQTPALELKQQEDTLIKKIPSDEVTIVVTEFRIKGELKAFTKQRLLALLDHHINQQLSLTELKQAANIITNFYREKGYFLARAYLPQQDVTAGVITIAVHEGTLDSSDGIQLNSTDLRLHSDFAQHIISNSVDAGQPLKKQQLERGLLLLNDIPGIYANAGLQPGEQAGSTRIIVNIKEDSLFGGNLSYNNYGNRYTGSQQATAHFHLNNLSGFGDQLALSATKATNGDYDYIKLNYSSLIGVSGLRAGLSYSLLNYGTGKELRALDSKGDAQYWRINARYPLIRNRKQSLYLMASYDRKDLYNEAFNTQLSDKQLDIVNIGLNLKHNDHFWGGGYSLASVTASTGKLDLSSDATNLAADQSSIGPDTQGHFQKLSWSATRVQYGTDKLTLIGLAYGQIASKNLDSSEKFQLGGATGVRAYPSSEAIGDDGIRATLEAHYRLGSHPTFGQFNLQTFYDWGRIRQFHNSQRLNLTTDNSYSISGYGVGLSMNKSKQYDVRLQWAHKIGSNPRPNLQGNDADGKNNKSRFWLSFSAYF